jgi:hypothetical protein
MREVVRGRSQVMRLKLGREWLTLLFVLFHTYLGLSQEPLAHVIACPQLFHHDPSEPLLGDTLMAPS